MTSTVVILGAAGRLGQVLASAFADAGWQVRAQARKALPDALARHPHVQALRCDALDVAALSAAARGAEVIVNALNPPYTEWDRLALPLADAALAVARATGALLMFPGNVYNFGRELPPLLTPDLREQGNTPKARIRIETEARLAAAQDVNSVVIRAGDFFGGPGRGSWFDLALASRLDKGRFIYPGPLALAHAWAYLPDLAQVFVRIAEQRSKLSGHRRFHFAGHTLTGNEMHAAMEHAIGRPLKIGNLPWGLIRLAAPFVPSWRELIVMRYLWQRPHALVDETLRELIGSVPQTPLTQALHSAVGEVALAVAKASLVRA